jgi:hypothetical protein
MAQVTINFIHLTDGRAVTVEIDDSLTVNEVITELIEANFIRSIPNAYSLAPKGGLVLAMKKSFCELGIHDSEYHTDFSP